MTRVLVHHKPAAPRGGGAITVLAYGSRGQSPSGYSIGNSIVDRVARLGVEVPDLAFDLVTVALAVTAADTFVDRRGADDGWSRKLEVEIPVSDSSVWESLRSRLERSLSFLTDDMWSLRFRGNGLPAPSPYKPSHRRRLISLDGTDRVCLFSGGLDSTVGVLDLLAQGHKPLLVSHAYRGDRLIQARVGERFPQNLPKFSFNASPFSPTANDVTMRSRSFNFIALGVLCACAVARACHLRLARLIIPENGFISLNPPLTARRIGALSTRTTHPHFISSMQDLVSRLGLNVELSNPYQFMTKGEMLLSCRHQKILRDVAPMTVSCGKWKRSGQQCGRCVPCIIRRAAFHAVGISDRTTPAYRDANPVEVMGNENLHDDILAMALAAKQRENDLDGVGPLTDWVTLAGPLPENVVQRDAFGHVVRRGLREVSLWLQHAGVLS